MSGCTSQSGIAALTWAAGGYSLLLAETHPQLPAPTAAGPPLRPGSPAAAKAAVVQAAAAQAPQQPPVAAALAAQAAVQVQGTPHAVVESQAFAPVSPCPAVVSHAVRLFCAFSSQRSRSRTDWTDWGRLSKAVIRPSFAGSLPSHPCHT